MPCELNWEPSGIIFRFSGVVTDEDVVESSKEVYASPHFSAMKYKIADFSMIEKFDVSSRTVREVAESDRKAAEDNPDVRVSIITSSAFVRGISEMYQLFRHTTGGIWSTEVFDSEEEARSWAAPPYGEKASGLLEPHRFPTGARV